MQHVVMFSGGIGSWAAAKRVAEQHGTTDLTLLFSDTLIEVPDLYRFLIEAAADIGGRRSNRADIVAARAALLPPLIPEGLPGHEARLAERRVFLSGLAQDAMETLPGLRWLADGRTPFEVFRDERFLGNSRVDPCSKILKRQIVDRWLRDNREPGDTIVYVGIDWTEGHRFDDGEGGGLRPRRAAQGWTYEAPMMGAPYLFKPDMVRRARECGLTLSQSYVEGFPHDNCGGGCCKAGQGQWAHLLRTRPAVYAVWEAMEEAQRAELGDVSMMTDRSGDGRKKPLTLRQFRLRIEAGGQFDAFAFGGCGCFVDA